MLLELTSPLEFFTDPILRAPTLGCMFMGLAAALVGVIVVLRKQSLLGESLSHAAYPGVILGVLAAASVYEARDEQPQMAFFILGGAFLSSLLGLAWIEWLQKRFRIRHDSALCFVLASFFGIGVTLASRVQFSHTLLYRQIQMYLYGQAATMRDFHILLFLGLALLVGVAILLTYKELQASMVDSEYARTLGIRSQWVNGLFFFLISLAVVVGIRCVGVVLMSAMLIAPAVAARQFTHRLWQMFVISGCVGMGCGFSGNYLSVELSRLFQLYQGSPLTLPTGPMVVLTGTVVAFLSLLLAPERGLLFRYVRMWQFRKKCVRENILKAMWYLREQEQVSVEQFAHRQQGSLWKLGFWMARLTAQGFLKKEPGGYRLTVKGRNRGEQIVRLHRLWELYLVDQLGMGVERVHCCAEEIEHILTPELELRLTQLLKDPKKDPHHKPIPPRQEFRHDA